LLTFWHPFWHPKIFVNILASDWDISVLVLVTDLVEASYDTASLLVCTRQKIFLLGGCGFFVSDVISGGLLDHLSPLCLALGASH